MINIRKLTPKEIPCHLYSLFKSRLQNIGFIVKKVNNNNKVEPWEWVMTTDMYETDDVYVIFCYENCYSATFTKQNGDLLVVQTELGIPLDINTTTD